MAATVLTSVLARVGGGVATRGNRSVLARIVKAMKASSMFLEEWSIPRDLNESMEMKRPKGWAPTPPRAANEPALPAANEAVPPAANDAAPDATPPK